MWITMRYRFVVSVSQTTVKPVYNTIANNTKRTAENAKRTIFVNYPLKQCVVGAVSRVIEARGP
jgi:hypothetical protein